MPDFPRGWTMNNQAFGAGKPTITVIAVPGVVRILDSFTVKIASNSTTATYSGQVTVVSSDGGVNVALALLAVGQAAAGGYTIDQASESGLGLAGAAGSSLTVDLTVAVGAGQLSYLLIQGHDI
jgi:hypothetical protein